MSFTLSPLNKRRRGGDGATIARVQTSSTTQGLGELGSESATQSYAAAQPSPAELEAYNKEYPAVPPREQIWEALRLLDGMWIRTLLLQISDSQSRVACEIWDEHQKRKKRRGVRGIENTRSSDSAVSLEHGQYHQTRPQSTETWITELEAPAQESGRRPNPPTITRDESLTSTIQAHTPVSDATDPFYSKENPQQRQPHQLPELNHSKAAMTPTQSSDTETFKDVEPDQRGGISENSFEEESKAVSYILTKEHLYKTEATQLAIAPEVYSELTWVLKRVREPSVAQGASFSLRKQAMEVLRSTGESICHTEGALGLEIRKRFRSDLILELAMVDVLRMLTDAEMKRLSDSVDHGPTFYKKMEDLWTLGRKYDIFQDLGEILKALSGDSRNQTIDESSDFTAINGTHGSQYAGFQKPSSNSGDPTSWLR